MKFNAGFVTIGTVFSAILLWGCASTIENEDTVVIAVSGCVKQKVGSDTVGVANLKVSLAKVGLSDSTDNNGFYSITATQTMVDKMGFDLDTLHDSAIVEKDGRPIYKLGITDWIDTLPTVFLEQRDIQGKLDAAAYDPENADIARIAVIIKNGQTTGGDSVTIDAWYFRETSGYSCFAYFQNAGEPVTRDYSVFARVFDSSSRFIGQSKTVRFTSKAGDIEIPTFNPYNAKPKASAGADTTISIKDTVVLKGAAVDSFGGTIAHYAWDIGNTGSFKTSSTGTVTAIAPAAADSSYRCILRVTDNDGNVAYDTMIMRVLLAPPKAFAGADTTVTIKDTIMLKNTGEDTLDGTIAGFAWDIGNTGQFKASPGTTFAAIAPATADTSYRCILRVTDDDGNVAYDTMIMRVLQDPPRVTLYADQDSVRVDTSLTLRASAFDKYGRITTWEWDIGTTGKFIETTADSSIMLKTPPDPTDSFNCVVKVTDDDGNTAFDTISIKVFYPQFFRAIGFAAVKIRDSANTCIVPLKISLRDSAPAFDLSQSFGSGVARLDAGSDSTLWYCDNAGALWEKSGGTFRRNDITLISSRTFKTHDIGVNSSGDVFAAGDTNCGGNGLCNNYYIYAGGRWSISQGLLQRVDVSGSESRGCHIGTQGDIYKEFAGTGWQPVGNLKAVEISAGAMIYAVGMDSAVYRYKDNTWSLLQIGTGVRAALVETNMKDEAVVVDASRRVHYKGPDDKWRSSPLPVGIEAVVDVTIY